MSNNLPGFDEQTENTVINSPGPLPREVAINQISWLCTHNAYNSADEIGAGSHLAGGTNQNQSILEQLAAGVRAFMIDIHSDEGGPRVRHVGGALDRHLPYEDLCDLLIKFKKWLSAHPTEVVMLLLEVASDVDPAWIRDAFGGTGPITRPGKDYDLRDFLYTHLAGAPWPTIKQLTDGSIGSTGAKLVVFRETDDGKGRITSGMDWYHDMWYYWLETPYSNTKDSDLAYWSKLQNNTYAISPAGRGDPATADFFNLNHFVDTGTIAVGSAGLAEGINPDVYLFARALIAWKMQGKCPTLSVDFFKSIDGQNVVYDTTQTNYRLNQLPTLSGKITTASGATLDAAVHWEGVPKLQFYDYLNAKYLDWTIDRNYKLPSGPTSHHGEYRFPGGEGSVTLTPVCPGYTFNPPSCSWNGSTSQVADFVAAAIPELTSGTAYTLFSDTHNTYLAQAQKSGSTWWSYTNTDSNSAHKHILQRVASGSVHICSGDEIYIRYTDGHPYVAGDYLRCPGGGYNDLWYEGGTNPQAEHRWKIQKFDANKSPVADGMQIYAGDFVTLKNMSDSSYYMCPRGEIDYVAETTDLRYWQIKI